MPLGVKIKANFSSLVECIRDLLTSKAHMVTLPSPNRTSEV